MTICTDVFIGYVAPDVAKKNKGDPGTWYEHKNDGYKDRPPPSRCNNPEAKGNMVKIYGEDEKWYKHEENHNYYPPPPPDKLSSWSGAKDIKEKAKGVTMGWYKHEHPKSDEYHPERPKSRTVTSAAAECAQKMRPKNPVKWYGHDGKQSNDTEIDRDAVVHTRLTDPHAEEYQERNKHGSADTWYTHDHQDEAQPQAMRLKTADAADNAVKNRGNADKWFEHDRNKDYTDSQPAPRCPSSTAQYALEKSRGRMDTFLKQDVNKAYSSPRPEARVKPEAQDIARKNVQGMLKNVLDQDANRGYVSSRPAQVRTVKPEAEETFKKNKGCMNDFMQGHLSQPPDKRNTRGVRPEAQEIAKTNKGTMDKLMNNYGKLPPSSRGPVGRAVKSEGEYYAERNKGTVDKVMQGSMAASSRPVARVKPGVASEMAQKYRGTVGGLLHMEA